MKDSKKQPHKRPGKKGIGRTKRPYHNKEGKIVMLTDQQKAFVDAVQQTTTGAELLNATQEIYGGTGRNTTRVILSENMRKPSIIEYLGNRGYEALDVLTDAMKAEDATWNERIRAADSVADRQFGKAKQQIEMTSKHLSVTLDLGTITGINSNAPARPQ